MGSILRCNWKNCRGDFAQPTLWPTIHQDLPGRTLDDALRIYVLQPESDVGFFSNECICRVFLFFYFFSKPQCLSRNLGKKNDTDSQQP